MIRHVMTILIVVLLVWLIVPNFAGDKDSGFPNRPIQIVVPYLAGGGTDTFARIIQKSLVQRDTLGVPVIIINQDGGSATIGSRLVKNSTPDGYRLLCHHEGIIATRLAGVVPYGPEAFRPIAQTGSIVLLMVVRADSKFRNLNDLLHAAQENPNEIRVGANQGSPAYFICKQLLSEFPGADFNFVSASGSKRITYLLGGKLEAGVFSLAEYLSFHSPGNVPPQENILAIGNFGEQRHAAIPGVATSREQGLNTQAENAYYIWAPKETPDDVADTLADAFKQTLADPDVIAELNQRSLDPTFRSGLELTRHLEKRIGAFEKLAVKAETKLPNFPAWTIGIVAALFCLVAIQELRVTKSSDQAATIEFRAGGIADATRLNTMGVACMAILVVYVVALQLRMPFVIVTPIAIFLIGATIAKWSRKSLFTIAQMALLVSLAAQFIFTDLFSVALP